MLGAVAAGLRLTAARFWKPGSAVVGLRRELSAPRCGLGTAGVVVVI